MLRKHMRYGAPALLAAAMLSGNAFGQANNNLTAEEKSQGFTLLFDGTMQSVRDNFVAYQKNGANVTTLPANIEVPAGKDYFWDNNATQDIRSKLQWADFELKFDYRISDNAGLYYRANVLTDHIYDNAVEYPIYNGTPVAGNWNAPGAAYDIYPPSLINYKPFSTGEWNSIRVRLSKDSVWHWHNDVMVLKYSMASNEFKASMVAHKWVNSPCLAVEAATEAACDHNNPYRKTGYIGLQTGYPGQLYIRNMRIANFPFPIVSALDRAASGATFAAVPKPGHGLEISVDGKDDFRLEIVATDGKTVGRFQGGADSRRFAYRAPGPGVYLIHMISQNGRATRKVLLE